MKKFSHAFIIIISFIWIALLFSFAISQETPVGSVSGRVARHDNGKPIANAKIWHPVLDQYVKSDKDGYFKLPGVPQGKYTLYLDPPMEYESSSRYNVNIFEAKETKNINFSLYEKAPYFSVYMDKDVIMPGELPLIQCSGYKTNNFSVKVYKLDPLININYLQSSRNLKKIDISSLVISYEKDFNADIDEYGTFSVKVKPELKENGFYVAVIKPKKQEEQRMIFNITNLGLVVKRTKEKIFVYSVNLKNGTPLAGASLRVYDNYSSLYKIANTDSNGTLILNNVENARYGILASSAGSYAYANIYEAYANDKYKVYLYTERPVYRPGQAVYYKGVVRRDNFNNYENVTGKDVSVEVSDADGNIIEKVNSTTNSFGSFNGKINLLEDAGLGSYSIKTTIDGENSYADFKVSEYKKPEYKVTLIPSQKRYTCGDKIVVDVDSAYYFGEPVANAEVSYTVYQSPYYAPWLFYDEFNNDVMTDEGYGNVIAEGSLKTNADGKAKIEMPTEKFDRDRMLGIEVDVKDKSLRTVTSSVSVLVTRGLFDIAIKPDKYVYSQGENGTFTIKAADYDNKSISNISLKTVIYKIEWREEKDKDSGMMQLKETRKEKTIINAVTGADGTAKVNYKFDEGGSYIIEASAKDVRGNDISTEFYIWTSSSYSSEALSGGLKVVADKKLYNIGDTAKILINTPWKDSTVLVTVEGSDIYSYEVIKIPGFSKTIDISVKADYFPNAYVEVCVVKDGHLESVSAPVYLNTAEKDLKVSIKPSKQLYRPAEEAVYDIYAVNASGKPVKAEFSFGVVDEALYAINEDMTPNINKYFYSYRQRLVSTNYSFSDYYSGGADKEEIKIRRKFEDTAYFKADVVTDENGFAQIKFILPENLTSWRATARAVTADTFVGQSINNITVSKDVLVRLETPRFITAGDTLEIAGVVHNYSAKAISAQVKFNAAGCKLADKDIKTVNIEKDGDIRVPFLVKAENAGEAVFTITVKCETDSDGMELKVPVLPHGVAQYVSKSQTIENEAVFNLNLPAGVDKNTAKLNFEFAPSIGSSVLTCMNYLINYPYGCTEQTMNSFMPAVIVQDTLNRLNIVGARHVVPLQNKISKVIRKGLDTIYSYQHADGGWGWWEYDNSSSYLTGFVVQGLNEAQKAGVKVDEYSFKKGVAALCELLKQKEEDFVRNNYCYEQNGYINARTYLLYVLSECGKAEKNDLIKMFKQKENLNNYSKALLAIAFTNVNLPQYSNELITLLNKDAQVISDLCHWPSNSWRYIWTDSDVETTAYVLKALIKLNPKDEKIGQGLRWLITQRVGNHWASTKDTAVILGVLCDYIASSGEKNPDFTANLYLNNEIIKQMAFNSIITPPVKIDILSEKMKTNNNVKITKTGAGALYALCSLQYFSGGENIKPQTNGIKVERQYFKLNRVKAFKGGYIDKPAPFDGVLATGEKLQVKIVVECPEDYRYVLIEDMLPAGCVIDMTEDEKNWGSLWYQKQVVRDEKVAFFSAYMDKGKHELTYNLRGEIPGEYHIMPAGAYLMYAPQVRGHSAEDRIKIK